ncbi:GNAT family N-acetyltransferase [Chromobacterium sp. IIBBL 290-4]|uniref:GNAT family N-acetyltransferase n=1 Tax=Chromobacterium sp. IIBBL 290-4 TaxID=2953890 RepID=UPI0020B8763E|nr:GNAT family N-acetyltransferase [Chromobacterium sp. IIBBL 290-4]UTH74013.1 GNAT family N-acetyltransferase [Chromobacterium sp. IIBBL 290-4]
MPILANPPRPAAQAAKPAFTIRRAEENDLAAISRFDEMGGDRRQEIASRCCLVAEQAGQVVAYASVQPAGLLGQPLLSYLCAAPAARGQGIGRTLVQAIQGEARGRMLLASTEDWCLASQKIFLGLGWRKIGELASVNKDGSSEYFYAIDLIPKD